MGDTKNIYYDSERPVSQQCFDEPFWISKTEITNQQFSEFINAGGYTERSYWTDVGWRTSPVEHPSLSLSWVDPKFNGPNQPVISVSWFEAMAYASWFGECRLPTEREWEYVARGPDGLNYPWGDEFIPDYIAFDDLRGLFTEEVGSHIEGASWVGALDMAGNAWEWTLSAYYGYPYDPYDGRENTANSPSRVLRGGGSYGAGHIHTTARSDSGYSNAKYYVGFRIVCTIP